MLGQKGKKIPKQLLPDIVSFAGPKATKHWMTVDREALKFQQQKGLAFRELKKAISFAFCLVLDQKLHYYELMFSSTPMGVSQQKVTFALTMERIGAKPGFHVLLKGESPPPLIQNQQVGKHGIVWDATLQFKYRVPLKDNEKLWCFIQWVLKKYGNNINKQTNTENEHLTWAMQLYQNRRGALTSCSLSPTSSASSSLDDCEWLRDMKLVLELLMRRYAD